MTTDATTDDPAAKPKRKSRAKKADTPAKTLVLERAALIRALDILVPFVPRKPVQPYEAGVRIATVDDDRLELTVVDGFEVSAAVRLPLPDGITTSPADPEVWDARRLRDMLKGVRGMFVTLDFTDRAKASVTGDQSGSYTLPLYRDPSEFPVIAWNPEDTWHAEAQPFFDALSRVAYAVGTVVDPPAYRNAQVDEDGVVCGFNGACMQRSTLPRWVDNPLLVPDMALNRPGCFDSVAGDAVFILHGSAAEGRQDFIGLSRGVASIDMEVTVAYARPRVDPHDLTRAWEVVDAALEGSGMLRLPVADLLGALDSAKVQADPRMAVVEFDLDATVELRSGLDDTNRFAYRFDGVTYSGKAGHRCYVGLYELLHMVEGTPDEFVDLFIEETSTGAAREPYVQFTDSTGSRAVIQTVRGM